MQQLNLPEYEFRIRKGESKIEIFDRFRKKFVVLTPEEWVRQNFLMFLISQKGYPSSLIAVEAGLKINKVSKRTDIVIYNNNGKPLLIVECKAPSVQIKEAVFDQAVRYNMTLNVNYIILTNGLSHYCCQLDYEKNSYQFLKEVPDYSELRNENKWQS
jgi:hypothetical protein